jgi:HSP20 family molecular chaperone IbpA
MYTANLANLLDLFEKDLPSWKATTTLDTPAGYIKKNDDSYELAFDVVGHPKDNISIDIEGSTLNIKAETTHTKDSILKNLVSTFNHSIRIPNEYDLTQTSADVDLGILLITIPKKKELKEKKISVKIK